MNHNTRFNINYIWHVYLHNHHTLCKILALDFHPSILFQAFCLREDNFLFFLIYKFTSFQLKNPHKISIFSSFLFLLLIFSEKLLIFFTLALFILFLVHMHLLTFFLFHPSKFLLIFIQAFHIIFHHIFFFNSNRFKLNYNFLYLFLHFTFIFIQSFSINKLYNHVLFHVFF